MTATVNPALSPATESEPLSSARKKRSSTAGNQKMATPPLEKPPENPIAQAIKSCEAGNIEAGLPVLETHLAEFPEDLAVLHAVGVVYAIRGNLSKAQTCFEKLASLAPKSAFAHNGLGNIYKLQGNLAEAAKSYREAIILQPEYADAHYNLALVLDEIGQKAEARKSLEHAILFRPAYPEAYNNLGNALLDEGRVEEAAKQYRQALAWNPNLLQAQENLVSALHRLGLYDEAQEMVERLLKERPDDGRILRNHARGLTFQGKWKEAEQIYLDLLDRATEDVDLWLALAMVRQMLNDFSGAMACYNKLGKISGVDAALYYNGIANLLMAQDKVGEAAEQFQHALMLNSRQVGMMASLGRALIATGDIALGIENIRHAVELAPNIPELHSNLIFNLHFDPTATPEERFAEMRKWNERHGTPLASSKRPKPRILQAGEKLRIGYVSGDFRDHSVGRCIEPVLKNHDRSRFQINCYSVSSQQDEFTARMKSCVDLWRSVPPLSYVDLAERIRQDGIDILIDLSGHTSNNRLKTFVEQPAALQMTWMGFFSSTGLDAIDYRISDATMDPVGLTESLHSEKLLRLPIVCPYLVPEDAPAISSPPLERLGRFTFGALTQFRRANARVLDAWAQILEQCKNARLVLFSGISAEDTKALERIYRLFALREITSDQLLVLPKLPFPEFMKHLGDIDLALDSFPYPGGMTSMHSLWMGVPVLTLAGRSSYERAGASLMTITGLEQFIASNEKDYISKAVDFVAHAEQLTPIRASLRERISNTPLVDAASFTRSFEASLLQAWETVCDEQSQEVSEK